MPLNRVSVETLICVYIVMSNTCCVLFLFCLSCLRLVYPMLPYSLDCSFLIAPSVFSNVHLYTAVIYLVISVSFHLSCDMHITYISYLAKYIVLFSNNFSLYNHTMYFNFNSISLLNRKYVYY
jgi:hypothetical protein